MTRPGSAARFAGLALAVTLSGFAFSPAREADAAPRTTLQVFAAASLTDAFNEIGRALEKQDPGLKVVMNFAGSQQLAAQIDQGANADVFASADDRWMDYLRGRGLLAASPSTFVCNRLVVIVPRSNPGRIRRLQDLARGGVKLVIGAEAVPVGHYTKVVFANLARDSAFSEDFAFRVNHNVVSQEENVKSVVGKVQLGEADAGVVYRSDVTAPVARYVRVIEIPESANVVASYLIAVVGATRRPREAQAFVDLVLSEAGQRVLERWGFLPRPSNP
jgi:molybdate transport system substrate-binding protein